MKALLIGLILLISSGAMAAECDSTVNVSLSTAQIMDNFDYYYAHQNECISVNVRLSKNQTCTAHIKVRMIEDPISDAPNFSISRCKPNESESSY